MSVNAMRWPLSLLAVVLAPTVRSPAQGSTGWEGPYVWFAQQGFWEIEHAAVIGKPGPHQGKVILIRDHVDRGLWLWDPAAPGAVEASPLDTFPNNMACGGHSWDRDGDWIFAGGDKNSDCGAEPRWTYVYSPESWSWLPWQDMLFPAGPLPSRFGYYYPTNVALHDGRVVTIGGGSAPWRGTGTNSCAATAPPYSDSNCWQVFNKLTHTWEGATPGLPGDVPFLGLPTGFSFGQYPRIVLLSTGDLFLLSQTDSGLDQSTPQRRYSCSASATVATWPPSSWAVHPYASRLRDGLGQTVNLSYPTAVQFPHHIGPSAPPIVDRLLVIGGHDHQPDLWVTPNQPLPSERLAASTAWEIVNPLGGGGWVVQAAYGTMNRRRVFANAVLTPDLQVYVVGGSQNQFSPYQTAIGTPIEVDAQPVLEPEMLDLLNPGSGWQLLSPHTSPRLYHSVALLLKDGRILVASGYKSTVNQQPPLVHTDAEIYSPPCLQQGLPRPSIVSAPTTVGYGAVIPGIKVDLDGSAIPANDIDFATLIRCGSVTHHFDADQRCIKLEVVARSGAYVTLASLPSTAQGGHFLAPPGFYFLFVVTTPRGSPPVRVPSVARFVQVL